MTNVKHRFSLAPRILVALICLLSTLPAAPALGADIPQAAWSGDVEQLLTDGWVETAPDVYQRSTDGRLQILAYGDAGPRIELGWIQSQIEILTESFEKSGSAEVAVGLQDLERRRDELVEEMRRGTRVRSVGETSLLSQEVSEADAVFCNPHATVNATAGSNGSGPQSAATTTYSDSCDQTASIYCYAFARGYDGFVYNDGTQADGPRNVTGSGSCSVSKTIQADNNCFATSTSQVSFDDDNGNPVTYLERDSTGVCGTFDVTISANLTPDASGNYAIELDTNECVAVFWQAASSTSQTSFAWSLDNSTGDTGSSFNTIHCHNGASVDTYAIHTVELVGTSGSATAQDVVTLEVLHKAGFPTEL